MDIPRLQYLISQGDRGAFDRFYHLYYEQVFRFAFYFLKNQNACSEVVTNVFLSIWKSRKKFVDVANVNTYMYVITKNEANKFLKNQTSHTHVSLEEIPIHFEPVNGHAPDDHIVNEEIDALLSRVIAELPEKCRLTFLMVRQENLTPKEIAKILSISESTVRVQLKNAIDKIVEKLKPYLLQ